MLLTSPEHTRMSFRLLLLDEIWTCGIGLGFLYLVSLAEGWALSILGLIPLAIGLNVDFAQLFATGNPHIFFGGDSVQFWKPLSWTIIFGLAFATLLTLVLVPSMLLLTEKSKMRFFKNYNPNAPKIQEDVIPEGALADVH